MRTTVNQLRNEKLAKGLYTDAADDMLLKSFKTQIALKQKAHCKSTLQCAFQVRPVEFSRALKMPHRGIFARRDAKRRARAVRIPPCNPCIVCCKNKKQRPAGCCFWRRRWDSNPRDIAVKLISSQSRYDRFDTSAYLVFTAPPRTAFGKMRDFDAR